MHLSMVPMRNNFLNAAFFFVCLLASIIQAKGQTKEELRASLKQATERLAFHPDSVELRLEKASFNMLLEQYNYAKEEYDYLLQRNPNLFAAHFFRAYANEKMGRYSFARIDYEQAIMLQPDHFEAKLGLAILLNKMKHYTEAMDRINQLLQQYPEKAEAYATRAGFEKEREYWELALYDFTIATQLDPNNKDYHINRLELLYRLNQQSEIPAEEKALRSLGIPKPAIDQIKEQAKHRHS